MMTPPVCSPLGPLMLTPPDQQLRVVWTNRILHGAVSTRIRHQGEFRCGIYLILHHVPSTGGVTVATWCSFVEGMRGAILVDVSHGRASGVDAY
jgi:hypothetical protein